MEASTAKAKQEMAAETPRRKVNLPQPPKLMQANAKPIPKPKEETPKQSKVPEPKNPPKWSSQTTPPTAAHAVAEPASAHHARHDARDAAHDAADGATINADATADGGTNADCTTDGGQQCRLHPQMAPPMSPMAPGAFMNPGGS